MKMGNSEESKIFPLVSVLCQAYNHGKYIEQCLNGILMQKTSFPFEVLVHDDASTDDTADVVREFELRYPEIIKPIYQTVNQYSQKKKVFSRIQLPRATGKYIAICEGDDYWTDPGKLQKQVDFLEANKDFAICFHSLNIENKGMIFDDLITNDIPDITDIRELTRRNYIPTPTIVFRNRKMQLPDWYFECYATDYAFFMLNAKYGKIKKIPDVMAVYRIHESNQWANLPYIEQVRRNINDKFLMTGWFSPEVNMLLKQSFINAVIQFFEIPDNEKSNDENAFYLKLISLKAPEKLMDPKFDSIHPKPVKVLLKIWQMRLAAWIDELNRKKPSDSISSKDSL